MKLLCLLLTCAALAGCAGVKSKTQGDTAYINGTIYTGNTDAPYAEAFVVSRGKIVFVGTTSDVLSRYISKATVDLSEQFVMPGLTDSHAHPGLVALIGEQTSTAPDLPATSKQALFSELRRQAIVLKDEPFILLGDWDVAMFLPDGPHKSDLDTIFPDKPVVLTDNSGHSTWLNSVALAMFGIDKNTPDLSAGVSMFVRDEHGELTGWVKEFALIRQLGQSILRPKPEIKTRIAFYLDYLSKHGVTSLWDAGNFENDHEIYSVLAELDAEKSLPLRYEGSYHIFDPSQIDIAVEELLKLRAAYEGENLKFTSIKVHFDGVVELGTAGMLTPYLVGENNQGGFLFTAERLADFLKAAEIHDIDIHFHSVGDAATREVLDAVALVKQRGEFLRNEVTISHLEHVSKSDMARFAELDVHANFTPHWWGGTYFGQAGEHQVGIERINHSQQGRLLFDQGANVTFSSDVTTMSSYRRANPFVGIQMAVTRQEYDQGSGAAIFGTVVERVELTQAIAAYTLNGARQLGRGSDGGSIEVGKRADFVVLKNNLFNSDPYSIHKTTPTAVVMDGRLVQGTLEN